MDAAGQWFLFSIDFDNLTPAARTLLLRALEPGPGFRHRPGLGKSLGLGSVSLAIEGLFLIDRTRRYAPDSPERRRRDSTAALAPWTRVRSLFPDEPVVDLLLAWIVAPVEYRGPRIERPAGLPQGAPVSPLLANLMLDDFDADSAFSTVNGVRPQTHSTPCCRSATR